MSDSKITPQNTRARGLQNDLDGLNFLHEFGWLRPTELARFMWPASASQRKNMSKLLMKWRQRRYVIERQLPENLGTALVLARAGVARLAEVGVHAKSGKDWGTLAEAGFEPPSQWKHDLLTAGFLSWLTNRQDVDFLTEPMLLREVGDQVPEKIPDALLRRPSDDGYTWIEVENARKSGLKYRQKGMLIPKAGHMRRLVTALVAAARGELPPVAGYRIRGAVVVYDGDARDERGCRINHRDRILAAIPGVRAITQITFAKMSMVGGTVESVTFETVTLEPAEE